MSIDMLSQLAVATISNIHTAARLGLLVERVGVSILIFPGTHIQYTHTHTHTHTYIHVCDSEVVGSLLL